MTHLAAQWSDSRHMDPPGCRTRRDGGGSMRVEQEQGCSSTNNSGTCMNQRVHAGVKDWLHPTTVCDAGPALTQLWVHGWDNATD